MCRTSSNEIILAMARGMFRARDGEHVIMQISLLKALLCSIVTVDHASSSLAGPAYPLPTLLPWIALPSSRGRLVRHGSRPRRPVRSRGHLDDPIWATFRSSPNAARGSRCPGVLVDPIMQSDGRVLGGFALLLETERGPKQQGTGDCREVRATAVFVLERGGKGRKREGLAHVDSDQPGKWREFRRTLRNGIDASRACGAC